MKSPVEYGTYSDAQRSIKRTIDSTNVGGREYILYHKTAGYEPAGSMARWTEERYGVSFFEHIASHGRMFLTESEARTLFNKWCSA